MVWPRVWELDRGGMEPAGNQDCPLRSGARRHAALEGACTDPGRSCRYCKVLSSCGSYINPAERCASMNAELYGRPVGAGYGACDPMPSLVSICTPLPTGVSFVVKAVVRGGLLEEDGREERRMVSGRWWPGSGAQPKASRGASLRSLASLNLSPKKNVSDTVAGHV